MTQKIFINKTIQGAIEAGYLEITKSLLNMFRSSFDTKSHEINMALYSVARNEIDNAEEFAELLIGEGVSFRCHLDDIITSDNLRLIDVILASYSVKEIESAMDMPIKHCLKHGSINTVEYLIEKGFSIDKKMFSLEKIFSPYSYDDNLRAFLLNKLNYTKDDLKNVVDSTISVETVFEKYDNLFTTSKCESFIDALYKSEAFGDLITSPKFIGHAYRNNGQTFLTYMLSKNVDITPPVYLQEDNYYDSVSENLPYFTSHPALLSNATSIIDIDALSKYTARRTIQLAAKQNSKSFFIAMTTLGSKFSNENNLLPLLACIITTDTELNVTEEALSLLEMNSDNITPKMFGQFLFDSCISELTNSHDFSLETLTKLMRVFTDKGIKIDSDFIVTAFENIFKFASFSRINKTDNFASSESFYMTFSKVALYLKQFATIEAINEIQEMNKYNGKSYRQIANAMRQLCKSQNDRQSFLHVVTYIALSDSADRVEYLNVIADKDIGNDVALTVILNITGNTITDLINDNKLKVKAKSYLLKRFAL